MASACVNNVGVSPGKFSSYGGWLSPRVSFTRDDEEDAKFNAAAAAAKEREKASDKLDLEKDAPDFEFRLDDPSAMMSADELISDGKLMPMKMQLKQPVAARSPERAKCREVSRSGLDPYLFSPKAPRCTSRLKEILGLKKNSGSKEKEVKSSSPAASKSMKNFRSSKSSQFPLLRDSDCESSLSMSSRLSLSSSSSSYELEDFPRLSMDAEKQNTINPISLLKSVAANSNPSNPNPPPRLRLVKPRPPEGLRGPMRRTAATEALGVSIDSPRMNPSGRIVFQSLERSSSSPSSFSGGPRLKHGGMERSYSANVRVTPILNVVPVCSLSKSGSVFGFGQLFNWQQKRDSNGVSSRGYQIINNSSSRNRTDRS